MQIVNGYRCENCTEIDLAKKGVDPAHPTDPPFTREAQKARAMRGEATEPDATRGALELPPSARRPAPGETRPTATEGHLGTRFDGYA